uniref:Cytochrome c biogenesis protein transmembrane region n=1 Tax=Gelidium vagum TaxID=35171 RepID=A0A141SE75_GELVA|nr:cytochrome c biogenesis protein transmembrane region [Gelidium vagum]AMK96593.1 cytochrome c biogenesis protein transmembrane region [Gelidium vagum]
MTLLENIEIKLYYTEQYFSQILSTDLHHLNPLTLFLLIIGGFMTSLNPCFISIAPLSISYISSQKGHNYLDLVLFSIGLTSSFLFMLLFIYFIDYQYKWIFQSLPILSSIIIIFLGLYLLQIWNLDAIPKNYNIIIFKKPNQINFFLMGTVVGLSSAPCSTPILTTLLFWISLTSNFLWGLIYILFYIIGLILPIITLLKLITYYQNFTNFNQLWKKSISLSGSIVVSIGIFSLLNQIFS